MKRFVAGLGFMAVIAVVAILLVMQNHRTAFSAKTGPVAEAVEKASPSVGELSGKVLETMDSGGYTYVLLATKDGEKWVAAPKTIVTVGQPAAFAAGMVMRDFKSETLNRTFPELVFSAGPVGAGAPAAMTAGECPGGQGQSSDGAGPHGGAAMGMGAMGAGAMGAMKSSGRVTVPPVDLAIEKATGENAFTVAEIYEKGQALNLKKVVVRGKVVKVSNNIMGKNWVHLQDGTGKPETGTHDLVLTSQQSPTVGEILLGEGILAYDKDFGSGYRYQVIIEETEFK
ncbi:MAG: DNA-binding protein [Deltaproteobacteria bacterium]|nr:DNA-binding protein [Deltaproteobacteria bacterium]